MFLRSHRFSLPVVLIALVSSAALAACSETSETASSTSPSNVPSAGDSVGSSAGGGPGLISDAASPPTAAYHANPLCHIDGDEGTTTCMPDDDATSQSRTGAGSCAEPGDPGAMQDGATPPTMVKACRIESRDGGFAATCSTGLATGTDGAKCEHGDDCGPGFDCVSGDKGTKTCRHYCCGGTCATYAANGSVTFCDVQSLVDVNQTAPVCMPIKRCAALLVQSGECAANETCTVVTDGGDTGCVQIGQQNVGESCDEAHCAADLACLGQPGARKCYRLCHVNGNDCPASQECVPNLAFKDANDGICN